MTDEYNGDACFVLSKQPCFLSGGLSTMGQEEFRGVMDRVQSKMKASFMKQLLSATYDSFRDPQGVIV